MSIEFVDTTLTAAEPLKTFENTDALGKAYLELHGKASVGDLSLLPQDLRDNESVKFYKNIPELAKGLIETKKLVGQIKKPPESPDGYKFTEIQNLHKGLTNVADTKKALAAMFHKAGIDNDKADQLQQMILTGLSTGLVRSDEGRAAKAKDVETQLRGEWGGNYDKNYNNVKNILERIGLKDLADDLAGNPDRIKGFHKISSLLSEDSIGKLGESTNFSDTKSKEGAQKRIKDILESSELSKALYNEKDPKHVELKKEWGKLHETAYAP